MLFTYVFTGLLLIACLSDLLAFRIPNAVPFALAALFLIKAAATFGIAVWPSHVLAFALVFGLTFAAFAFGVIGGGDAKLLSALALWFGMAGLPSLLAITAIGGGVLAMVLVPLRYLLDQGPRVATSGTMTRSPRPAHTPRVLDRRAPIPYALPMTAAALWLEWPALVPL